MTLGAPGADWHAPALGVWSDVAARELPPIDRTGHELTSRLVAIADLSADFIGMAALDGSVTFVNRAGRRMLGIEPDDEVTLARFHTAGGMKRAKVLQEHGYWEGEAELRHFRSGALIPTYARSFLLRDDHGNPAGFATVQTDLREAKRLQEHLRHTQKMEVVGRLTAAIAHDFNNMLSVIMAHSGIAIEDMRSGATPIDDVQQILKVSERAAQLTQRLLAFSGQQAVARRAACLNAIVTDVERMIGRLLPRNVRLSIELDPGISSVTVDVGQIEQALVNLVVNARDAMPAGGALTITTATTVVGGRECRDPTAPPGRYATLRVSDTGVGIDDATLRRIFEPFFTTKPRGMGTGLGLATVLGIVKQSGGHVTVESRVGEGTTFALHLPTGER